ncbi:MAG: DsbA family oxidoreductase [Myxococcota bacterium]
MKVQIWSDVVCPWCYIGKRRFEAAMEQFDGDIEVEWKSFELDPGAPKSHDKPLDELLASKYRTSLEGARRMIAQMTDRAREEGLDFDLLEAQGGNTLDAHRLIHFAAEREKGDEMKERLLSAYMTEQKPISDRQTLVALAEDVGLDGEQVAAMLATDEYKQAVRDDELQAHQVGVRGVPFFLVGGRYGVSGAQTADVLVDVLERAEEELEPEELETGVVCDEDGCAVDIARPAE